MRTRKSHDCIYERCGKYFTATLGDLQKAEFCLECVLLQKVQYERFTSVFSGHTYCRVALFCITQSGIFVILPHL